MRGGAAFPTGRVGGRVGHANLANTPGVAYLCGFGFAKVGHSSLRRAAFPSILSPLIFSRFSAFPPTSLSLKSNLQTCNLQTLQHLTAPFECYPNNYLTAGLLSYYSSACSSTFSHADLPIPSLA